MDRFVIRYEYSLPGAIGAHKMSVNDYDVELFEAIEDLVAEGELEAGSDPFGVAQQVIHRGYESLSPKQRTLYDAVVIPALKCRGEDLEVIRTTNSAEL
jgi:hypothetical protein